MSYLIIYSIIAILWSSFCVFRSYKLSKYSNTFIHLFLTFIINFVGFPVSILIVITKFLMGKEV